VDLLQRRHAPLHVLETLSVDLLERHELDFRMGAGDLLHALRQGEHRDFLIGTDVEHLPVRLGLLREHQRAAHDVADVREAARLRAVAVDEDRVVTQRLLHEARQHHAVRAVLARSAGVEATDDDHR
jgi:hypothetical protein